jgi:hypothetical protein
MINDLPDAPVRRHDRRRKCLAERATYWLRIRKPLVGTATLYRYAEKLLHFATTHDLLKPAAGELFCETGPAEMLGI